MNHEPNDAGDRGGSRGDPIRIAGKVYSERLVAPVDQAMMGHLSYDERPVHLYTKHWWD